jgi:hypothetical protein
MFEKIYAHPIKDIIIEREGRQYIPMDLEFLKSNSISLEGKGYYCEYRAGNILYEDIPILYRHQFEAWFGIHGGEL